MSDNQLVYLTGTAMYAKVFEDNRDETGFEDAFVPYNGCCTIDVILDDVELEKLKAAGSKKEGRETEDGKTIVKFSRKFEVRRKDTGEIIEDLSGPPQVVDSEGNDWEHSEENPKYIGNGSNVTVAVLVRADKKKKAIAYTSLEGVKVNELVEYDPENVERKLPF